MLDKSLPQTLGLGACETPPEQATELRFHLHHPPDIPGERYRGVK